jgi:hypothetical protein
MTQEAQKIVDDIRNHFGIDVEDIVKNEILPTMVAKKWLVKSLYFKEAKSGRTYTDIKLDLSVEYDISVSAIEKMVYRGDKVTR